MSDQQTKIVPGTPEWAEAMRDPTYARVFTRNLGREISESLAKYRASKRRKEAAMKRKAAKAKAATEVGEKRGAGDTSPA